MKTPLYERHSALNAQIVDFAGWQMPMRYSSTVAEHHAVRQGVGMFDVSHMLPVDFEGPQSQTFLKKILASNVSKLDIDGRALYTVMLNEDGGIIDDLIVYRIQESHFRIIFNAGVAESDLEWINQWKQKIASSVSITPRRDLSIIAVQGPQAMATAIKLLECPQLDQTAPFNSIQYQDLFIGRTGYTGEDGVEILCPNDKAPALWDEFHHIGAVPCGLGARDTLRLEAGMNLNGQDMTPEQSPFESALSWVVDFEPNRDFVGQGSLIERRERGISSKLTGVVLKGGVIRHGYEVQTNAGTGVVTSGSFSPTLGYSIALARLPRQAIGECSVLIRNKAKLGKIVRPPFVRHGVKVHK